MAEKVRRGTHRSGPLTTAYRSAWVLAATSKARHTIPRISFLSSRMMAPGQEYGDSVAGLGAERFLHIADRSLLLPERRSTVRLTGTHAEIA